MYFDKLVNLFKTGNETIETGTEFKTEIVHRNTLGKDITVQFFKTPEDYLRLKEFWSVKMRAREEVPAHIHLTYKALIGKDWRTGFANHSTGRDEALDTAKASLFWAARNRACSGGAFKLFDEFLSEDAAQILSELLSVQDTYQAAYKQTIQVLKVS